MENNTAIKVCNRGGCSKIKHMRSKKKNTEEKTDERNLIILGERRAVVEEGETGRKKEGTT